MNNLIRSAILSTFRQPAQGGGGGFQIDRSLRFNYVDNAYLQRTLSTPTSRRIMTYSFWVKRSTTESYQTFWNNYVGSNPYGQLQLQSDKFQVYSQNSSGTPTLWLETSGVYRDFSAWYHFVIAIDTTQATASNRAKLYVNGTQVTSFGTATYPSQNADVELQVDSRIAAIGRRADGGVTDQNLGGYLAEYYFIDGQALTPADFGEYNATTGVWQPIAYAGTYGTNGFHLDFADNTSTTTLGYDISGNDNNWTLNNFSVTAGAGNDSLVDTPMPYGTDTGAGGEVGGNYATWNPLRNASTLTNGNLDIAGPSNGVNAFATVGVTSGKWYWEVTIGSVQNTYYPGIGVNTDLSLAPSSQSGQDALGYMYLASGQKFNSNSVSSYGASFTTNDVIGVALDMDAGTITFYKNGSSQGQAFSGITGTAVPVVISWTSSTCFGNFGQRPFAYTAPSGFKALCTTNLPTPDVVQSDTVFNTVLWSGDGTGDRAITGVGFQPDILWTKVRNQVIRHQVMDVVRGSNKTLLTNSTLSEVTSNPEGYVTSFDSDGFSTVNGGTSNELFNQSGYTYVGWSWKAGGSGVSNTDGDKTATISANPTAGISIVTYTIASASGSITTFGHGLGVAPSMVIFKVRDATDEWTVYHSGITSPLSNWLTLNTTNGSGGGTSTFSTSSTTFGVRETRLVGEGSSGSILAYCFAPVEGFSAMGSYTGNGSTNGPFVYTGFKPAYLLVKCYTRDTDSWLILDNKRNAYNTVDKFLFAQDNAVETQYSVLAVDFLSNGFKMRGSAATNNASGYGYIYMAFAENPFKYSLAR